MTTGRHGCRRGDNAPLKLEQFLPYRLNVVASLVSQALSRIYADRYGIGVPEWRVLVTLGQYGMMTGKSIGAHSHMHKTKVSRAVALLEKRKLVTRRANRADLREAFLALTPAGRAMYDDLAPIALDFANRLSEVVGQPVGEIERDRREIVVHGAAGRRQRQERLPQVGAVGPPGHELALFQERDRARDLGLVHVAVRADRFAGHHAVLAERHQHAPFRHADAVAVGIDARQRLRDEARHHVEPVRQELFELERGVVATSGGHGGRVLIGGWLFMVAPARRGALAERPTA